MIKVEFAQKTDKGQIREHNEDCMFSDLELGLWLVADGMGGHAGGEIASAIVCEAIPDMVGEGHSLEEAISATHQMIKAAPENGRGIKGMGSTVVALQLSHNGYEIGWVGDSRAYLWNGHLTQLSVDQSFVQKLIEANAITPEQARSHPKKNLILQSLGASQINSIKVDLLSREFKKNDIILLCSDGLNNELTDPQIDSILNNANNIQSAADELVEQANRLGGSDNITVVLVKCLEANTLSTTKSGYFDRVKTLITNGVS